MDADDYLASLERDTATIADTLQRSSLDAEVASCPGWRLGDLASHVYQVLSFWERDLQTRPARPENWSAPEVDDADLADALLATRARLEAAVRAIPPDTTIWTWTEQTTAAFVPRRMAQEVAVHRWDAESAVGESQPIEAQLAADGIDEYFMLARASNVGDGHERALLTASDLGQSWVGQSRDGVMSIEAGQGPADAVMTGTASDLLLVLWRRLPMSAVEVTGDAALAQRLRDRADLT